MEDERVESVLDAMAAVDQARANLARSVLEWLTAGESLEEVDLAGVMRFAWYELPVKWSGPPDLSLQVVEVAGELFERLGMEPYAAVFRRSDTRRILDAYAVSPDEGFAAFREAYAQSGIDPPDVEGFIWGKVMGWMEVSAKGEAERALERAMVAGDLIPGARGWKSVAQKVTAGVLDGPSSGLPGQSWRSAILTERLDEWLRSCATVSQELHRLRSRHVNRLLHPLPTPPDAAERMAPINWFLGRAEEGIRFTQAGYLSPAVVQEGCERFGWSLFWTDRQPRSESEVGEIYALHRLLRRVKAVRRRGPLLLLTRLGQQMSADVGVAWRIIAAGFSDGEWPRAVAEVFTLLRLESEYPDRELRSRVAAILTDAGWQVEGEALDSRAVSWAWSETRQLLGALGGVDPGREWTAWADKLTSFGEATLMEQIRVEATGPRSRPY